MFTKTSLVFLTNCFFIRLMNCINNTWLFSFEQPQLLLENMLHGTENASMLSTAFLHFVNCVSLVNFVNFVNWARFCVFSGRKYSYSRCGIFHPGDGKTGKLKDDMKMKYPESWMGFWWGFWDVWFDGCGFRITFYWSFFVIFEVLFMDFLLRG